MREQKREAAAEQTLSMQDPFMIINHYLSSGLLRADDVRIARVGDGERRHAEVFTARSTQVDVVCTHTHTSASSVSDRCDRSTH